jgi:hypothetical protein
MHRTNSLIVSFVSLGLLVGCTWSPDANINGGGQAGGAGRNTTGTGVGGTGVGFDGGPGPTADANCGVTNHMGNRLPPDLLLVFDKSGSMQEDPTTGNNCNPVLTCNSKWHLAVDAVNTAVGNTQDTIRWGLKLFANGNACTVNPGAAVPIAINNGGPIMTALAGQTPGGSTPTTAAITRGGDYLATLTTPNPRFLVLVTDGQPTCGPGGGNNPPDDANAIAAVATQATRGFGTFVIGVNNLVGANANVAAATLSQMSINGQHPKAGTPNYYSVTDGAGLVAALEAIGTQVTSCTYTLDSVPPDPSNVKVLGDNVAIPANDQNGWVYETGMRAVTLKGSYCDAVTNGTLHSVVVLFGCLGTPIP